MLDTLGTRRTAKQVEGQAGEDAALEHLRKSGLKLVERNFRCKAGEIDLIMQEGSTLVFVEVRKRSNPRFGGAAASVTWQKQRRLIRAAQFYLLRFRDPPPCRFDVVALEAVQINWLRNAIEAG
jgi:putative endonuclease